MKKFLLLSLGILLGAAAPALAQTGNNARSFGTYDCGTPQPTAAEMAAMYQAQTSGRVDASTLVPVAVQLTVVRNSAGQGRSLAVALQAFADACEALRPSGLRFYLAGPVQFVNNTSLMSISVANEDLLCVGRDNPLAMNIYMVQTVNSGTSSGYAYINYPPYSLKPRVIISETFAMAHEMGHSMGLLHTFNNNNATDATLREKVARTNCTTAGDMICDTPADPFGLTGATTSGCTYTGTATDAAGARFAPMMDNAMSYYICGNTFTDGQVTRMLYARSTVWALALSPASLLAASVTLSGTVPAYNYPVLSWTQRDLLTAGYFIERRITGDTAFHIIEARPVSPGTYIDSTVPSGVTASYRLRNLQNQAVVSNIITLNTGARYCALNTAAYATGCSIGMYTYMRRVTVKNGSTNLINRVSDSCGVYSYYTPSGATALPTNTPLTFQAELYAWTTGYIYTQFVSAWIDYDRDGVFEDNERILQAAAGTTAKSGTFTIPASVAAGTTRMRVRSEYASGTATVNVSPCTMVNYGETEDYLVKIGTGTAVACVKPAAAVTVAGNRIQAAPTDSASYTYQWYQDGAAISGGTTRTAYIAASGSYQVRMTRISGGCDSLSAAQAATYVVTASGTANSDWKWVRRAYSTGADRVNRTRTTATGYVYSAGAFTGTLTLEGASTTSTTSQTLASAGGIDGMLIRHGKDGKRQWAVRFGGTGDDEVLGLTTDASDNAYVSGYFTGTMTVTPVSGTATTLVSAGGTDMFIAKISPAGAITYAFKMGGTGNDRAEDLGLTPTLTLLVAGSFEGAVAIKGTSSAGITLTSRGLVDGFMAKFTNAGAIYWAVQAGGTGNDYAYSVVADKAGNEFVGGSFTGTAIFSASVDAKTIAKTAAGSSDAYVWRVGSTGSVAWVNPIGGTGADVVRDIAADPRGTGVIAVGNFTNVAAFGTLVSYTSKGGTDAFATSITTAGAFTWAKQAGGTGADDAYAASIYTSGNVVVAASFTGAAINFNGTANSLTSAGGTDALVVKLSASTGAPLVTTQFGGTGNDQVRGIDTATGDAYNVGGIIGAAAKFGNAWGPYTDAGLGDAWTAYHVNGTSSRMGVMEDMGDEAQPAVAAAVEQPVSLSLTLYPNPARESFNIRINNAPDEMEGEATIHVIGVDGRRAYSETRPMADLATGAHMAQPLAPGLYLVRVETAGGQAHTLRLTVQQ